MLINRMLFCLSLAFLWVIEVNAQCILPLQYANQYTLSADSIELNTNSSVCQVTGTVVRTIAQGSCYIFYRLGNTHQYVQIQSLQAPLTITVRDSSKNYGQNNPQFHYTLAGLINGDDSTVLSPPPTLTCSALANSDVGQYAITAMGASALNYQIQYIFGNLTVNPALQSISINPIENQNLSLQNIEIQATASSGLSVSYLSLSPLICTVQDSNIQLVSPGQCVIQVSQTGSQNFQAAPNVQISFAIQNDIASVNENNFESPSHLSKVYDIWDSQGKLVYRGYLANAQSAQELSLAPGYYFLIQGNQGHLFLVNSK